jgi:hypothetical protein
VGAGQSGDGEAAWTIDPATQRDCFVLMRFDDEADPIYHAALRCTNSRENADGATWI